MAPYQLISLDQFSVVPNNDTSATGGESLELGGNSRVISHNELKIAYKKIKIMPRITDPFSL